MKYEYYLQNGISEAADAIGKTNVATPTQPGIGSEWNYGDYL